MSQKTEEKGKISVHTDKLFPIIKKWLYSQHDIFLRELVSNAHDAIIKLDRLADLGEYKGKLEAPLIKINIDKTKRTLTLSDNGLGMTAEEVKKYINQIAFSGAEEFLNKYEQNKDPKDQKQQIIGHFGLGFFSSYMVADLVEIKTLSYREKSEAVHWQCAGSTDFTLAESTKKTIGTEVILHINKESDFALEEDKIKELVEKYSNFLPVEIQVNDKQANVAKALWNTKATGLKDKDYNDFYQKLFPGNQDPLFSIHLDVDYPFKLKGILYFPKVISQFDFNKMQGRIKLFCNNVFVSDNILDIIPEYLHLLQGAIDSPDIPLNVSRSALQADENVKKISTHIVKKIADKLNQINKKDRKQYEEYWQSLGMFVKFGVISDPNFYEKVQEVLLFKTIDNNYLTLKEYQEKNSAVKEKIIYATNKNEQISYINQIQQKEKIEILLLDDPIDNHLLQQIEMKMMPTRFMRVDAAIGEDLSKTDEDIKKEQEKKDKEKDKDGNDKKEEKFSKTETEFVDFFKKQVDQKDLEIKFQSFGENDSVAIFTVNEHMRRFSEMTSMMNQSPLDNSALQHHTLLINTTSPAIKKIFSLAKDKNDKEGKTLCQNIYDLALLQQNKLQGQSLLDFIGRVNKSLV